MVEVEPEYVLHQMARELPVAFGSTAVGQTSEEGSMTPRMHRLLTQVFLVGNSFFWLPWGLICLIWPRVWARDVIPGYLSFSTVIAPGKYNQVGLAMYELPNCVLARVLFLLRPRRGENPPS